MKKNRILKRLRPNNIVAFYDGDHELYFSIGYGKIKVYNGALYILGKRKNIDLFFDIKMQYLAQLRKSLENEFLEDYSFKLGQLRVLQVLFS